MRMTIFTVSKNSPLVLAIICLLALTYSLKITGNEHIKTKPVITKYDLSDTSWKNLSLRQKIGQTVIANPTKIINECKNLGLSFKKYFKRYPPGGIFVGTEVIKDHNEKYIAKTIFGEIPFNGHSPVNLNIFEKFLWNY